jgi:hypothetical protein
MTEEHPVVKMAAIAKPGDTVIFAVEGTAAEIDHFCKAGASLKEEMGLQVDFVVVESVRDMVVVRKEDVR